MAAPIGNQNAVKAKPWADAIRRALARAEAEKSPRSLNALADKLIDRCLDGDVSAIKELGDRLDGKPAQVLAGDDEAPLRVEALVRYLQQGASGGQQ